MSDLPPKRVLFGAIRGNQQAIARLVEWGLPRLEGQVDDLRREIRYRHEHEWDAAAARQRALDGEVTAAEAEGAMSDLYKSLVRVLGYTPAALLADDPDDAAEMNARWNEAVMELLLRVHNPTIRYGLAGAVAPANREAAVDYADRVGREVWGTVVALTRDEEVVVEDFPPDAGYIVGRAAEAAAPPDAAADGGTGTDTGTDAGGD